MSKTQIGTVEARSVGGPEPVEEPRGEVPFRRELTELVPLD